MPAASHEPQSQRSSEARSTPPAAFQEGEPSLAGPASPEFAIALRRAGLQTRARVVASLQRNAGNAIVNRLLVMRAPAGPAVAEGGLATALAALLPLGEEPFPVNIELVLETIHAAPLDERLEVYNNATLRGSLIEHLAEDGRDRVLSALLEGPLYTPNPLGEEYKRLAEHERQAVDTETNASFLLETGISRALDWASAIDKPLARRWLKWRDVVMLRRSRRARRALYLTKLREAIGLLSSVPFGRATGDDIGAGTDSNYDLEFWEEVSETDPEGDADAALRLKDGVPPSLGIDELFANLDKWAFDCGEFVQVAHLYAQRHTLGEAFDDPSRLEENGGALTLVLRPQGSTGLLQARLFKRSGRDEAMKRVPGNEEDPRSVEVLLAGAPLGSRVVWHNKDAPAGSDFEFENTIKLGADSFAAHPYGIVSRADLELNLAREQNPDADAEYIAENVFIVGIEHYFVQ